ncbi:MAG TPA: substrate-binding domain-containing protein [Alphaproteobacteria bacterium]|jgi:mxaJ protein|nr:substrate-binding domain-containing protein [Alphaproteobacteria bacterium]
MRTSIAIVLLLLAAQPATARDLKVCADPNNMPFSNKAGEGFENRIAELVARDLGATVRYTWWAQRRGFVRNTLKTGDCDVWPGVAAGMDMLTTTHPYYTSSYVFVSRAGDRLDITSFDDPRLKTLTVGVQMVGNDAMNTPPAHALARRGITGNVRGYMLYGDYRQPNPPAAIIDAVARHDIDVGVAWGPMAGYFAGLEKTPLSVSTLSAPFDGPGWPMRFGIAMGVRKGDTALADEINTVLDRETAAIRQILSSYRVPLANAE